MVLESFACRQLCNQCDDIHQCKISQCKTNDSQVLTIFFLH